MVIEVGDELETTGAEMGRVPEEPPVRVMTFSAATKAKYIPVIVLVVEREPNLLVSTLITGAPRTKPTVCEFEGMPEEVRMAVMAPAVFQVREVPHVTVSTPLGDVY